MALHGRHWLGIWLLAGRAGPWPGIWRQTDGLRAARALTQARERRAALEGTRSDLQRRIRDAESRALLIPRAQQRLGLRQPADTEIILLPVPSGGGGGGEPPLGEAPPPPPHPPSLVPSPPVGPRRARGPRPGGPGQRGARAPRRPRGGGG